MLFDKGAGGTLGKQLGADTVELRFNGDFHLGKGCARMGRMPGGEGILGLMDGVGGIGCHAVEPFIREVPHSIPLYLSSPPPSKNLGHTLCTIGGVGPERGSGRILAQKLLGIGHVKIFVAAMTLLIFGLWLSAGLRSQASVAGDEATVQSQLTAVLQPTPTATVTSTP